MGQDDAPYTLQILEHDHPRIRLPKFPVQTLSSAQSCLKPLRYFEVFLCRLTTFQMLFDTVIPREFHTVPILTESAPILGIPTGKENSYKDD